MREIQYHDSQQQNKRLQEFYDTQEERVRQGKKQRKRLENKKKRSKSARCALQRALAIGMANVGSSSEEADGSVNSQNSSHADEVSHVSPRRQISVLNTDIGPQQVSNGMSALAGQMKNLNMRHTRSTTDQQSETSN